MALTKPILETIAPFDATLPQKINFTYSTDNYANIRSYTYNVYNANSLKKVMTGTFNPFNDNPMLVISKGYAFYLTLPANVAQNGANRYYIEVCVNENGISSPYSDKKYFSCYATPEISCSLNENAEIADSSISPTYTYSQVNGEGLQAYTINLLDSQKQVVKTSGLMYDINHIAYTFRGIAGTTNDEGYHVGTYYVQFLGTTVSGMACQHVTEFHIKYREPSSYGRLIAENEFYNGSVKVSTNVVIIQQDGDSSYNFVSDASDKNNQWIDLTGKKLSYSKNFNADGDFSIMTKVKGLYNGNTTDTVFALTNNSGEMFVLTYYIYEQATVRFKLKVSNNSINYILYSKPIALADFKAKAFDIRIKRINNIYQLVVKY